MSLRVAAEDLARLADRALARRGVPPEHRALVVDGLVETSLRGVDTHGIRLLPTYLAELDGGRSRARPELAWPRRSPAAALLDAGGALGLVAGGVAAREAVRLARENGCGAVAVTDSNHFGAAAVYTLAMARRGTVGLAFTNSDALVAPFGGRRPLVGTNPVSLAVRGEGRDLFCADFATSQVSYSRVKAYGEAGRPVPPGWALAADGRDAAEAPPDGSPQGPVVALQPLGGYKGECLGMMVEILCALLAGTPFDHELSHLYEPPYDAPRRVAHLFVALDVGAFTEPEAFRARVSRLLALVRGAPAAGGDAVLAPGDPEEAAAVERRRSGIPLGAAELAALRRIDAEDDPGQRLDL